MEKLYFTAYTTADTAEVIWDKPEGAEAVCRYDIFLDGSHVAVTEKTHVTLTELQPEHSYRAEIRQNEKTIGILTFETKKILRRINVTEEPYFAKGDGMTMNTVSLQRAFDDCSAEEEVYFPAGVYLTGALNLHSDMAVYRKIIFRGSGAVLRAWSRNATGAC